MSCRKFSLKEAFTLAGVPDAATQNMIFYLASLCDLLPPKLNSERFRKKRRFELTEALNWILNATQKLRPGVWTHIKLEGKKRGDTPLKIRQHQFLFLLPKATWKVSRAITQASLPSLLLSCLGENTVKSFCFLAFVLPFSVLSSSLFSHLLFRFPLCLPLFGAKRDEGGTRRNRTRLLSLSCFPPSFPAYLKE